jgi:hypothetical protein
MLRTNKLRTAFEALKWETILRVGDESMKALYELLLNEGFRIVSEPRIGKPASGGHHRHLGAATL